MRIFILVLVFSMFPRFSFSQQIPLSSQYMMNRLIINPGYAGELGFNSVSLSYRKQWVNIPGSPSTQNISIHGPIKQGKLGLGLLIFQDVIGLSRENNISASFAYKIKNKSNESLSFGLGASAVFSNTKWNQVITTEIEDAVLNRGLQDYIFPDFSAGFYYQGKRHFFGFSIPMFIQHKFSGASSNYSLVNDFSQYNYLLETGSKFELNNQIIIKPSLLIRYLPSSSLQMDINCLLDIHNKLGIGVSYRTNDAAVVMLQFHANYQLILGYSYDRSISKLEPYNNGSHELFLRYDIKYKLKSIDPRFF